MFSKAPFPLALVPDYLCSFAADPRRNAFDAPVLGSQGSLEILPLGRSEKNLSLFFNSAESFLKTIYSDSDKTESVLRESGCGWTLDRTGARRTDHALFMYDREKSISIWTMWGEKARFWSKRPKRHDVELTSRSEWMEAGIQAGYQYDSRPYFFYSLSFHSCAFIGLREFLNLPPETPLPVITEGLFRSLGGVGELVLKPSPFQEAMVGISRKVVAGVLAQLSDAGDDDSEDSSEDSEEEESDASRHAFEFGEEGRLYLSGDVDSLGEKLHISINADRWDLTKTAVELWEYATKKPATETSPEDFHRYCDFARKLYY